jgi:hypothetical protein
VSRAEAFLASAEDVVIFREVGEDDCDKSGPGFIDRIMETDGPFIGEMVEFTSLVKKARVRSFPCGWSGVCKPHENEEVAEGPFEWVRHHAEELVGDSVRTRGLAIA